MRTLKLFLTGAAVALALLAPGPALAAATDETPKKPHILLVVVDDFGYNNIGYHRTEYTNGKYEAEVNTPTLDRLMRQGIKLNRHYVYNYCSPSRSSLQSGRLPVHVSVENTNPVAVNPNDPVSGFSGIPRNMTGIASKLRSAGYRTHMTGKWDAGMATWDHTPMGRGYETFLGYYHHANDEWTETLSTGSVVHGDMCSKFGPELVDLWNTTGPAIGLNGTGFEDQIFADNSLQIIRDHDPSEPLFLFHSFRSVHTPLQIPSENEKQYLFLLNKHKRRYAAMVAFMDTVVGDLVSALAEKDMWKDTFMVLTSDNGGPIYGIIPPGSLLPRPVFGAANNLPLRGGKLADWEGGIRVNAFVSGGALAAAKRGTVLEDYIHIADWYATFCEAAGVDPTDDRAAAANLPPIDSISHWKRLTTTQEDAANQRTEIHVSAMALIQGKYKIVTGTDNEIAYDFLNMTKTGLMPFDVHAVGYGPSAIKNTLTLGRDCTAGCLFDIIADPNEDNEITKDNPEIVAKMMARLKELNKNNFHPDRGQPSKLACTVSNKLYSGFYGPFIDVPGFPSSLADHAQHQVAPARENVHLEHVAQLLRS
ncbi:Arylsulfatase B [Hondaea fermentalgiana]|uniref:Arylsulfatase B n=1 Tax=Hondaea fermentalgiana TaxID=2315210 RepID=A0A2R5GQX4_9STRA|nr:Arylsulfatase B [Hondaea fermentalgiana]|eukprot:GBG30284.1 Arylsulfatase B [Hondaea fermentalgiana]